MLQPLELQKEVNIKIEEPTQKPNKSTDLQSTKNKTKKKRKLNNSEESIANEKILNSPRARETKPESIVYQELANFHRQEARICYHANKFFKTQNYKVRRC